MADANVATITPSMTYKELKDALLRAGVSSEELFGAADKLALLEVAKRHGLNNSAVPADTVVASEAASALTASLSSSLAVNARTANATTTASAAAQRRLESSRNRVPEQRLKLSAAAAVVDVVSPPEEIATPPTDSASTADTRRAGALAIGGHALFGRQPSLEYESAEAQRQRRPLDRGVLRSYRVS